MAMLMIEPQNVDGDMVIIPAMLESQSTIPSVDRTSVTVHAQLLPPHNPYARRKLTNPKTVKNVRAFPGKLESVKR